MTTGMTTELKRTASRVQILGLALNDVIGSGIYLLPAAATALLGHGSVWAVLGAGAVVSLLVLCFAEAGTHFDRAGGAYLYTRAAFGPLPGFAVGWMTWLARVASVASLSAGFAQAIAYGLPALGEGTARALVIALPLLALTALNLVGARAGVGTAMVLVVGKLIPLALFVAAGVIGFSSEVFLEQIASTPGSFADAAFLLLFAYAGFENTPAAAGEYKNPRRDVPVALLQHIVFVTVLYVVVQALALGTLPGLAGSESPLAEAASGLLGGWAGIVLTIGAAVSILGTNGNTVFAGPRYLFALAKDGFGPSWLAGVHPRWRTPAAAILTQTVVALPLALTGGFVELAKLSVVARLATYFATALAVPVLRRRSSETGRFRIPGGPVVPVLAAVLTVGLAASASLDKLIMGAVALVVGALIYLVFRRSRSVA